MTDSAQPTGSLLSLLAGCPRTEWEALIRSLPPSQAEELLHDWRVWARPSQLAPGTPGAAITRSDWSFWLLLAGRGFGKTRAGAEFAISKARTLPGSHGALVAPTTDDARKTMLSAGLEGSEGASGILAISPPGFRPEFEPSKRILTWPNGSVATLYSAEEPDRLRGPQHHWGWADELAAWEKQAGAWDQFLFGLRLGAQPQACITTTPRPIPIVRELLANPRTVVTRGGTYDNRDNLAAVFLASIVKRYEGTRLGRQELLGEVLDDVPGALWQRETLDRLRVQAAPELSRVVVAIDPAVTSGENADETGIVVAGVGVDGAFYVLADRTCRMSPDGWARRAIVAFDEFRADRIIAEVNNGGEMVELTLRTVRASSPYTAVHASRGKRIRAEPIAALYEQGKVHHVGSMPELEDQMCMFLPEGNEKSPDRVDALVWALTELSEGMPGAGVLEFYRSELEKRNGARAAPDNRLTVTHDMRGKQ